MGESVSSIVEEKRVVKCNVVMEKCVVSFVMEKDIVFCDVMGKGVISVVVGRWKDVM